MVRNNQLVWRILFALMTTTLDDAIAEYEHVTHFFESHFVFGEIPRGVYSTMGSLNFGETCRSRFLNRALRRSSERSFP